MPGRKLIEIAMPVAAINLEAEREKNVRSGLPSHLHLWWSRRAGAVARSVLFASLVDDPAEQPERFPTEEEQAEERQRLFDMTAELARPESMTDERLLERARAEISHSTQNAPPVVFDPFCGGGSIPVEAHRLGLSTEASDLNPVAVMITTVVSDLPGRFTNRRPVHPGIEAPQPFRKSTGLTEDIRWYGEKLLSAVYDQIGYLYPEADDPETGNLMDVTAWLWARTVQCPNPGCGCTIPLPSSYALSRKKGQEVYAEPVPEGKVVRFRIRNESRERVGPKAEKGARFRCPACGEYTTDAYVKECGRARRLGSQMMAIAAEGETGRVYLEPSAKQEEAANCYPMSEVPHGALPNYSRRFSPPLFGLTDYADLFTGRQLIFLTTMLRLTQKAQDEIERQAVEKGFADDGIPFLEGGCGALAYAQAIRSTLVLGVSKYLERCSNLCSWDSSGGGSLRGVFSRAAMPMIWDYAETNPFCKTVGFSNTLARICEAVSCLPCGAGHTVRADAALPCKVRNAVLSTEFPYYDRVSYAELSDFFYVWLKLGVGDLFPSCFGAELSSKQEELTSFAHRWGGDRVQADAFYREGLGLACKSLCLSTSDRYPSTVGWYYSVNREKAETIGRWESLVTALIGAGFMITAAWPLGMKRGEAEAYDGKKEIPVTIVLRKRPDDAPQATRRQFVAAVKRELPRFLVRQREEDFSALRVCAAGRALYLFSRYRMILDADGTAMQAGSAVRMIEQEIDTLLYVSDTAVRDEEDNGDGGES